MKQITILLLLLFPAFLFGQNGTTLDEYRYLSKGYIYQKEMGLDANKEGYLIKELHQCSNKVEVVGMYKQNHSSPQALLFIVDQGLAKPAYICLPNAQADERVVALKDRDHQNFQSTALLKQFNTALQEYLFVALNSSIAPSNEQIPQHYAEKTVEENIPQTIPKESVTEEMTSKGIPNVGDWFNEESTPTNTVTKDAISNSSVPVKSTSTVQVAGDLQHRGFVEQPTIYKQTNRGTVVIKVCVDERGSVTFAKFTQKGSTTLNKNLKETAINAAMDTQFTASNLIEQCGTMLFQFK